MELDQRLQPGRVFGEIALFSPNHERASTGRGVTPCTVLPIHESTVRQLYFQNPAFGFHLIQLLAAWLSTDVNRVEQRWAEAAGSGLPCRCRGLHQQRQQRQQRHQRHQRHSECCACRR